MTGKEYLMQIDYYDKLIANKLAEVYKYRQLATSISIATGEEKVQMSLRHDKLEKSVIRILEAEEEAQKIIDKSVELQKSIIKMIEKMSGVDYSILFKRYVEKKNFSKIADEIGYNARHTLRLHGKALYEFEKKYKKEINS